MKHPIKWHEECLGNVTEYLREERERVTWQMAALIKSEKTHKKDLKQLILAKQKGLTAYDSKKFGIPRKKGGK